MAVTDGPTSDSPPLLPSSDSQSGFALEELKEIVFADLEELLKTGYYKGQILPCHGSHEIFVPLLHTLDQLLVIGAIQEDGDLQRLLRLLDPQEFATDESGCTQCYCCT